MTISHEVDSGDRERVLIIAKEFGERASASVGILPVTGDSVQMIPHQQALIIATPLKNNSHGADQQNDRDQSHSRDNPHSSSLLLQSIVC
jgi:hypothetical protein